MPHKNSPFNPYEFQPEAEDSDPSALPPIRDWHMFETPYHTLPPGYNAPNHLELMPSTAPTSKFRRASEGHVPSFIRKQSSSLFEPASAYFPTRCLPPLEPSIIETTLGRRVENVQGLGGNENWDWGLRNIYDPYMIVGQQVAVRQLDEREEKWTLWYPAIITRKCTQKAFLGIQFTWYEVKVADTSERLHATPFVGEIWNGVGQCPYITPQESKAYTNKLRLAYVQGLVIDPETQQARRKWQPVRLTSSITGDQLSVELFSKTKRSTGCTGSFVASQLLPYSQKTAQILRSAGELVGEESTH